MTDDRASTRGPQPGHWLLIGLVVLLVAAGVFIVVRRGDGGPTAADPTAAPTSQGPVRTDCVPEVGDSYVNADNLIVRYGFVYRSKCDQVVRQLRFEVTAGTANDVVNGGVLFPGGELAAAGTLDVPAGEKVGRIEVKVLESAAFDPRDFDAWGPAEVVDLRRGEPDRFGGSEVSGTLKASSIPVCVSQYVLTVRDKSDKLIYAATRAARNETKPAFPVPALPGADFTRTRIYAAQLPRTAQPPSSGVPCDGS